MKCICISCFNYYDLRMKSILNFFKEKGFKTIYLYADFNHFNKAHVEKPQVPGRPIHVPSYQTNLSIARLNSHRIFAKRVKEFLFAEQPDVVYSIFPPNLLVKEIASYKKQFPQVKVALDCYDLWPESFPIGTLKKYMKVPFFIWRKMRDDYLDIADLMLTPSKNMRNFLKSRVREIPVRVLYPVIGQTTVPDYSFNVDEEITFCYLGNVNYITDLELLIKLLFELSKRKSVCVHFIGKGKNYDDFVQRLKAGGIRVIGHGVVFDMDEKNKIFAQCDLGINTPRKEIQPSISLKSIEYLRAGLPFINSGIGDNQEMIESEQIGINVKREDLKTAVTKIAELTQKDLLEMHKNCKKYYQSKFLNQDMEFILQGLL